MDRYVLIYQASALGDAVAEHWLYSYSDEFVYSSHSGEPLHIGEP